MGNSALKPLQAMLTSVNKSLKKAAHFSPQLLLRNYFGLQKFGLALIFFPFFSYAQSNLENPVKDGIESGISAVSGWHCSAENIEVFIDGKSIGMAGTGTLRTDTNDRCGHSETGFSLLINYGAYEEGEHQISLYADGELFAQRAFSTLQIAGKGIEFSRELTASGHVLNFPKEGDQTELEWVTAKQSFVVSRIVNVPTNVDLSRFNGNYIGNARGLENLTSGAAIIDPSEFNIEFSANKIKLVRNSQQFGVCTYNGSTEIKLIAGIVIDGEFDCNGLSGTFSGTISVFSDSRSFSAELTLISNDNTTVKENFIGLLL